LAVEALVDTGFSDELALPPAAVAALSLPYLETITPRLSDGQSAALAVYTATLRWHGVDREVAVVAVGTEPLLGMSLFDGSDLRMRVTEGGTFTLTPFSDVP